MGGTPTLAPLLIGARVTGARFIVSPDDALEMTDLRAFTCNLMTEMERDLGTKLDWIAVDHWNTKHPHVLILVRGKGGPNPASSPGEAIWSTH
jgi:type IV secretory pathway VirD2 relaxase